MAIRKTTKGPGANYRPTKSGAGMTSKGVKAYRAANPGSTSCWNRRTSTTFR